MSLVTTSEAIDRIISDLILALTIPVGVYCVLKDKVPPAISQQMSVIGDVSSQFAKEVSDLRDNPGKKIDLHSPAMAAEQMRKLALDWKRYEMVLSDSASQILASGVRIGDPTLDRIMESLPRGLKDLKHLLASLEAIQPKHLTAHEEPFGEPLDPKYDYKLAQGDSGL
jgi:hypothetical protein